MYIRHYYIACRACERPPECIFSVRAMAIAVLHVSGPYRVAVTGLQTRSRVRVRQNYMWSSRALVRASVKDESCCLYTDNHGHNHGTCAQQVSRRVGSNSISLHTCRPRSNHKHVVAHTSAECMFGTACMSCVRLYVDRTDTS